MATAEAAIEKRMSGFAGDEISINTQAANIAREAPRWVVFCGGLVHPDVMRKRSDLSIDGEVFGTKFRTLYRTKYLLRKCEMSPMLMAKDFVNEESLNRENRGAEYESIANPLFGSSAREKSTIDHYFHWCYPGEEIGSLISTSAADDIGIREFETLRGVSESDVVRADFQRLIFNGSESFPAWNDFLAMDMEARRPFHKISALEKHLSQRKEGETELRDLIDVYLASCDQYRVWGDEFLDRETRRVKSPMSAGGYVHTYSITAVKLFEQLEVTREDYLRRDHVIPNAPVMSTEIQAMMQQMMNLMERQNRTIEMLAGTQPEAAPVKDEEIFTKDAEPPANNVGSEKTPKPSYAVGTKVIVNGLEGEIVAKPFGRYQVKFADASKDTFEYTELTPVNADN